MEENTGSILVIDDNRGILRSVELLLKKDFKSVTTVSSPEKLQDLFSENHFDLVLMDISFNMSARSGTKGIYWYRKLKEIDPDVAVIIVSSYEDIPSAVKVVQEGAFDFVQKPWDPDKLLITLRSAFQLKISQEKTNKLTRNHEALNKGFNRSRDEVIGNSVVMQELYSIVDDIASNDKNILVQGEIGTGKELIAREIHNRSPRKNHSFASVDISTINESSIEKELFGFIKDSHSENNDYWPGRFVSAEGGTLYLDEVTRMPISLQNKLLKVLKDQKIKRTGSKKSDKFNVRLICATNKPIKDLVKKDLFNKDLYKLISEEEIKLPPLRERGNDVQLLSEYFLNKFRLKYDKPSLKITEKAIDKLLKYKWKGNVQELKHSIEKATILSHGKTINESDFQFGRSVNSIPDFPSYRLDDLEEHLIEKVMHIYKGNMSKVARELDISRTTLYAKIKKYKI
jgi:DNA-binding NtrC family response regulator